MSHSTNSFPSFRSNLAPLVFVGMVLLSGPLLAAGARHLGWDLGWNQTGETSFWLMLLGVIPGTAAWLAWTLQRAKYVPTTPRVHRRWYWLLAWSVLPFLGLLAGALTVLLQGAEWDFSLLNVHHDLNLRWDPKWVQLPEYPPAPWTVWTWALLIDPWLCFLPAWFEEYGWRGFGYAWLAPRGFWFCALSLGFLEWAWKLPLIFCGFMYPEHPWLGSLAGLGFFLGTSVICTWLRSATGGLGAPALARATLFGAATISMTFTVDYEPLWGHLTGFIGVGVLGLFVTVGALAHWFTPDRQAIPASDRL